MPVPFLYLPLLMSSILCFEEGKVVYEMDKQEKWLDVYTRGSILDKTLRAGARVYSDHFTFYLSVEAFTASFGGDLNAILVALRHLALRPESIVKEVVFLTLHLLFLRS